MIKFVIIYLFLLCLTGVLVLLGYILNFEENKYEIPLVSYLMCIFWFLDSVKGNAVIDSKIMVL
jgi:hypothetical protein